MAVKLSISEELSFFLKYSIREMEDLKQRGCITDRLYKHYCFLWLWSAFRIDFRHERLYSKGAELYWRRIQRVQALVGKIRALGLNLNTKVVPYQVGRLNP